MVVGLIIGALLAYSVVVTGWGYRVDKERKSMQERLLTAWKDGFVIPPEPEESAADFPESPEFPPALEAWINDYEGIEAQAKWRNRARVLMAKYNHDVGKVIAELESPVYG